MIILFNEEKRDMVRKEVRLRFLLIVLLFNICQMKNGSKKI
jgi:hypothetical protein